MAFFTRMEHTLSVFIMLVVNICKELCGLIPIESRIAFCRISLWFDLVLLKRVGSSMALKNILESGLKRYSRGKLMFCHMLSEISEFLHDVFVASCLEFITQLWLVSVAVHWVADKEEVEFLSELTLDKFLKFMADIVFSHSYNGYNLSFLILWIQCFNEFDKLMLVYFGADLNPHWVWNSPKKLNLTFIKDNYMSPIKLSGPFANPQHVCRVTVIFAVQFLGQWGFIWQDKPLMWCKHLTHVFKQIIMCGYWFKISFTQLTMLRVTILYVHIIHVITLVVVDLFPIVNHKLWTSRFCILTCDPTDYHRLLWALKLY